MKGVQCSTAVHDIVNYNATAPSNTPYSYKTYHCVINLIYSITLDSMDVGPCHHGMARPRVADGGMASYMEGSCE